MKVDVNIDEITLDKTIQKEMKALRKEIELLIKKLDRRDTRIRNLKKEIERMKADAADTSEEVTRRIFELAYGLVTALNEAKWIDLEGMCPLNYQHENDYD